MLVRRILRREIEHQLALNGKRHLFAVILLNQSPGQVYPGGQTSRGIKLAVLDQPSLVIDAQTGMTQRKRAGQAPIGSSPHAHQ